MKKGLVLVLLILSLGQCKKTSRESSPPIVEKASLSIEVTLSFEVFNHTQGFLKEFSRKAQAGKNIKINISELGVDGVDERRIVVREGRLGRRVAYSRTGACEFSVPEQDSSFTVYLMNASHEAEYRAVDVWVGIYEGNLQFPREMKWSVENRNGYSGPDGLIENVMDQLNKALDFPWTPYGKFIQVFTKTDSHFYVGYGYCEDEYGNHTLKWAGVNPDHCPTEKFVQETFLEEIFELVTNTENIAERDSVSLIADPDTGLLNPVGRDLLAYIFVKDEKEQ